MRSKAINEAMVIEMAEKIIREEGLTKCSMRRLSKELGIAVGTIFNYFESRESLMEAVFETSWSKTLDRMKDLLEAKQGTMDSLKEMSAVLVEDVEQRNGLGGLIKTTDTDFWVSGIGRIRLLFTNVYKELLLRDPLIEEAEKMAQWLVEVIFFSIRTYREMTDRDWQRIEGFLYLK